MFQQLTIRNLRINSVLLLLVLLTFSVSCKVNQNTLSKEETADKIIKLERQALDEWSQGKPLGFLVNVANDFTYFDDIAAQNRVDGFDEMKNYLTQLVGKIPPHNYELFDPKVQVYDDVAILTLRYHPTSKDGKKGSPWKATSVYHLKDGNWKVVHAHWSLVKEGE